MTDFDEADTGSKKKKKKKAGKKKAPATGADKNPGAAAAPAKKKKLEKPKTALSVPEEDEEEIDLVAKMEEARRAMPNACVVSQAFIVASSTKWKHVFWGGVPYSRGLPSVALGLENDLVRLCHCLLKGFFGTLSI